jgi:hypothetical protein
MAGGGRGARGTAEPVPGSTSVKTVFRPGRSDPVTLGGGGAAESAVSALCGEGLLRGQTTVLPTVRPAADRRRRPVRARRGPLGIHTNNATKPRLDRTLAGVRRDVRQGAGGVSSRRLRCLACRFAYRGGAETRCLRIYYPLTPDKPVRWVAP